MIFNTETPISSLTRAQQDALLAYAVKAVPFRFKRGSLLNSPSSCADYLQVELSDREAEVFGVIFLDNRHRVIKREELFHGTVDGASVHPRIVVQKALNCNAVAVVFYHNHPSGVAEPSAADQRITNKLKAALELIEVRVLDHLIVGEGEVTSFAEQALI